MLLNEFLKEHRRAQEVERSLREKIAQQEKQIETLTTGLEKVSAQVKLAQPAKQLASSN